MMTLKQIAGLGRKLVMFLGLCSFLGVTAKVSVAVRLGIADTFVLIITAISAWFLNKWVLESAPYLRIIAFIVVIASMVQITEMAIKKWSPALFRELGIYLPLITTNCAIWQSSVRGLKTFWPFFRTPE